MHYVGIDIGSTASKVVVRGDKELHFVLPTGWSSKETTLTIKEKLLNEGIDVASEETKVVATGYGRIAVDFADYVITEITCHARGGKEFAGDNCAIIDVGGQDTKVILLENGIVQDFLMNDMVRRDYQPIYTIHPTYQPFAEPTEYTQNLYLN